MKTIPLLMVGLTGWFLSTGCIVEEARVDGAPPGVVRVKEAGPPPWAPAHGYRRKAVPYLYYYDREIFYQPGSGLWFWPDRNAWKKGTRLPGRYSVHLGDSVRVHLEGDEPYRFHKELRKDYPPQHRRGKDNNRDHRRGRGR